MLHLLRFVDTFMISISFPLMLTVLLYGHTNYKTSKCDRRPTSNIVLAISQKAKRLETQSSSEDGLYSGGNYSGVWRQTCLRNEAPSCNEAYGVDCKTNSVRQFKIVSSNQTRRTRSAS